MKKIILVLMAVWAVLAWPAGASAQAYPSRPVQLIVPFGPGGGTDLLARALGTALSQSLNGNVVVQYRPGAQGSLGAGVVAHSPGDGYTVLFILNSIMTLNPWIYETTYDPVKSFKYVGTSAIQPILIMTNPKVPARSLAELTALAKAKPGAISIAYASSFGQLAIEFYKRAAKVDVLAVPYKESGTAIADLIGGRVDAFFSGPSATLSLVKAGSIRALAVTSDARLSALADVPTSAEAGLAGFDTTSWFGFAVPADTPDAIVAKLNAALKTALGAPGVKEKVEAQGMQMTSSTPDEMTKMIAREYASTGQIVKAANIR